MNKGAGDLITVDYLMILVGVVGITIVIVVMVTNFYNLEYAQPHFLEGQGYACQNTGTLGLWECRNNTHICTVEDKGDRYTITDCEKLHHKYCIGAC